MNPLHSEIFQSALSTKTLSFVRLTVRGVWLTGGMLLLAFILWILLQRGGLLEKGLPLDWRWRLESWRIFLGPLLFLLVLGFAWKPFWRCWRNPLLPGQKLLVTFLLLGLGVLGVLAPLHTWRQQLEDEKLCREIHLPLAWRLWRENKLSQTMPACPAQWDPALGGYLLVDQEEFVIVDRWPWHPHGAWGITTSGEVKKIPRQALKNPLR